MPSAGGEEAEEGAPVADAQVIEQTVQEPRPQDGDAVEEPEAVEKVVEETRVPVFEETIVPQEAHVLTEKREVEEPAMKEEVVEETRVPVEEEVILPQVAAVLTKEEPVAPSKPSQPEPTKPKQFQAETEAQRRVRNPK